jgi:VWFA-related protein
MTSQNNLVRYAMLAACAVSAFAQPSSVNSGNSAGHQASDRVLNVVARDGKGRAITDLTSADFQVFDDGKLQRITSFRTHSAPLDRTGTLSPKILIVYDLLNASPSQRGYTSSLIVHTLEPLEQGDSVYLYLLTNEGDLYPVRALPSTRDAKKESQAGIPWTKQIRPLLDNAIQNIYGIRRKDQTDVGIRTGETFKMLAAVAGQFSGISGSKTIVWITRGAPNWLAYPFGCRDVAFEDAAGTYLAGKCLESCGSVRSAKCLDYTPFLDRFSAELQKADTVLSSVEEIDTGALRTDTGGSPKDTLQQLANFTGGRVYGSGDVDKAVTQSLADAHARYELTYAAPPADGRYHKIKVTCSRKGIHIQAPGSYYADRP